MQDSSFFLVEIWALMDVSSVDLIMGHPTQLDPLEKNPTRCSRARTENFDTKPKKPDPI